MSYTFVSIIIPTYREWHLLKKCIDAIANQTYPKENFEVIIVNNDPKDPAPDDLVLPENFTLIEEGKPGSYAARNTALKIAKGEIIGFTDSDCIPDANWIKNAVQYLTDNPWCTRVAGNISIIYESSPPTTAELYNTLYAFRQKKYAKEIGTSVTANLFTYRHVFDAVGPFNDKLMSLGDIEWGKMAHKAGFKISYVDNVMVKHPARDLEALIKKEKRVGGGVAKRAATSKLSNFLGLLNSLRPRLAEIKFVNREGNGFSPVDKIKVLWLRHYLLGIRAYEAYKVQMGKKPSRT